MTLERAAVAIAVLAVWVFLLVAIQRNARRNRNKPVDPGN